MSPPAQLTRRVAGWKRLLQLVELLSDTNPTTPNVGDARADGRSATPLDHGADGAHRRLTLQVYVPVIQRQRIDFNLVWKLICGSPTSRSGPHVCPNGVPRPPQPARRYSRDARNCPQIN
jgi:hypothetical protein